MTNTATRTISEPEMNALKAFAAANGRAWKSKLADIYWYNARIWRDASGSDAHGSVLQSIRNSYGSEWLSAFRFPSL